MRGDARRQSNLQFGRPMQSGSRNEKVADWSRTTATSCISSWCGRRVSIASGICIRSAPTKAPSRKNLAASIDAGHYEVFADIVDKYGFPWTLVGTIDMPNVTGPAFSGDDSKESRRSFTRASDTTTSMLADGTQVVWRREGAPLKRTTDDPRVRSEGHAACRRATSSLTWGWRRTRRSFAMT